MNGIYAHEFLSKIFLDFHSRMPRFLVIQVRSQIKVSEPVIFGDIEDIQDSSRARKAVLGDYNHSIVFDGSMVSSSAPRGLLCYENFGARCSVSS